MFILKNVIISNLNKQIQKDEILFHLIIVVMQNNETYLPNINICKMLASYFSLFITFMQLAIINFQWESLKRIMRHFLLDIMRCTKKTGEINLYKMCLSWKECSWCCFIHTIWFLKMGKKWIKKLMLMLCLFFLFNLSA